MTTGAMRRRSSRIWSRRRASRCSGVIHEQHLGRSPPPGPGPRLLLPTLGSVTRRALPASAAPKSQRFQGARPAPSDRGSVCPLVSGSTTFWVHVQMGPDRVGFGTPWRCRAVSGGTRFDPGRCPPAWAVDSMGAAVPGFQPATQRRVGVLPQPLRPSSTITPPWPPPGRCRRRRAPALGSSAIFFPSLRMLIIFAFLQTGAWIKVWRPARFASLTLRRTACGSGPKQNIQSHNLLSRSYLCLSHNLS